MATIEQSTTKPDEYQVNFTLWRQVRAAIKGKYAVNEIVDCLPGPQYKTTPYYSGMSKEQQQAQQRCEAQNNLRTESYWSRGRFFNATGRTQESLDGMIWSKQPEVELPSQLEYLETDATGDNCGLREVAQETTDEVISIGRHGILVDMPTMIDAEGISRRLTQAESESGDNSPKLIQYLAEQIKFFAGIGPQEIKLTEEREEVDSDGEWECKKYIRRLVIIDGIYHNQLWNDNKEMISDVIPIANGSPLKFIPFQFFGADNNSPQYSKVPMYDLANVNLGHYVLDCDNRDNLHFHGQGMTVVYTDMTADEFYDFNPNGLNVGAKGMNQLKSDDKVEILQLDSTGAIPAEMERDEKRMIYLGAQLVQDSSSTQTATAAVIDSNASMSTLKRISMNVSSGLEQCLEWVALFLGSDGDITYKLNTDFVTDTMDAQTIAQHFQAVQSGLLPIETYYDTARTVGFTKKTNQELKELSEQDNLDVEVESEVLATLRAELEAAEEEIERLRNA